VSVGSAARVTGTTVDPPMDGLSGLIDVSSRRMEITSHERVSLLGDLASDPDLLDDHETITVACHSNYLVAGDLMARKTEEQSAVVRHRLVVVQREAEARSRASRASKLP